MWIRFDDISVYEDFISVFTSLQLYSADKSFYDIGNGTVLIESVQKMAGKVSSSCSNPAVEKDYCIVEAR